MKSQKTIVLRALAAAALLPLAAHAVAPVNDNFAQASVIGIGSSTVDGSSATAEKGEPDHFTYGGALGASHSVWWKFTPTFSGTVQIDTRTSGYDTVLAVYTGTTFANLHRVAQDDDSGSSVVPKTSLVTIPVTKGVIYHIAVDGFSGDITGSTTLNVSAIRINTPRTYQMALTGADLAEDNGLLTLTTSTSSLVTGKLTLGAHAYAFSGAVATDGHLLASVNRPGQQPALMDLVIGGNLDGNVFGPATGTLRLGDDAITVKAYPAALYTQTAPCPRYALNRHYNYAIDTSGAVGYGVATVTVGITGVCTTAGALADGTTFAFTSPLLDDSGSSDGNLGTGGTYVYHLPLYSSLGQITGQATFDASVSPVQVTGALQWFRPAPKAGTVYLPQGINGSIVSTFGNFYEPPQAAHRVDAGFDTPTGQGTLEVAELDFPGFTKGVTLSTSNVFSYGATNPNLVKIAVGTSTGVLTGTVKLISPFPTVPAKISTVKGVIIHAPGHTHQFFGFALQNSGSSTLVLHP